MVFPKSNQYIDIEKMYTEKYFKCTETFFYYVALSFYSKRYYCSKVKTIQKYCPFFLLYYSWVYKSIGYKFYTSVYYSKFY